MNSRSRIAAAVLAVLAAAGLVVWARRGAPPATGTATDATPPSASASSPSPPPLPSTGQATVAVYDDGRPETDLWVVFHDANGTVTSVAKTGKDGRATGGVSPKSMVTVATGSSLKSLMTIQGVEPGDEVLVGETEDEGGRANTVCRAMVTLPGAHPKAMKHVVSLGVGTTEVPDLAKPLPMGVLARFVAGGKFPVLAEAIDARGDAVAFAFARPACAPDAGDPTPVDVKLPAWSTDYRAFDVVIAGAGAGAGAGASLTINLAIASGEDHFERGRRTAPLVDKATLRFEAPRPLGTKASYKLAIAYDGSADRAVLEERREDMPEHIDLDLEERLLPRVEGAAVEAGPAPARPRVRWRTAAGGAGAKADVLVVRISWPSTRDHVWTILAPPDTAGPVVAPALPDELGPMRPDGKGLTAAVALLDASLFAGYADVKKKGLGALEDPPEDAKQTVVRYSVFGDLDF